MFKDTSAFSSFSTDDIAGAKDFYGGVLGLSVAEAPEGLGLNINGGGRVFIYPKPNHEPATFTVLNFEVADIDAAVDQLTAAGVQFEHYDLPMMQTDAKGVVRGSAGQPGPAAIAWFKDPAGNIVSVIQNT